MSKLKRKQRIELIEIDKINLDPTNPKRVKGLEKCFKKNKCRKETFESIPMLYRTECLKPSEETEKIIDKKCCPKITAGDYIRVEAFTDFNRYVVFDGNHRIQAAKNQGAKKILAIVEYED